MRLLACRFQKINDACTLWQLAQVGLRIGVLRGDPCFYLGIVAILEPPIVIDYVYAVIGIRDRNFFRFRRLRIWSSRSRYGATDCQEQGRCSDREASRRHRAIT